MERLVAAVGISIIQDSYQYTSIGLLKYYLQNWIKNSYPTIVFSFSNKKEKLLQWIESENVDSKLVIIDCFSNGRGWKALEPETTKNYTILPCSDVNSITQLKDTFSKALEIVQSKEVSILIDSLGPLLLRNTVSAVHQFLHSLHKQSGDPKKTRLLSTCHADYFSTTELNQLGFGAETIIKVDKSPVMLDDNKSKLAKLANTILPSSSHRLLVIQHSRPSGRVAWATEGYGIDEEGNLYPVEVPKKAPVIVEQASKLDPMANLTFSVKLTESEKAAKDQVVLPYMHHLNPNQQKQGGEVIYYDSDEDFDEEDPDDDLDI